MDIGSCLQRASALALIACAGCGFGAPDDSASVQRAPSARPDAAIALDAPAPAPAARKKSSQLRLPDVPMPLELPPVAARGSLMQRLPKSTLLAVRLPHVEKLRTAYERTFLRTLMDSPEFGNQSDLVASTYGRVGAELSKELPDYAELEAKFLSLEGEAVLALVSFDLRSLVDGAKSSDEFPATCALMFDAGLHAADFDALLQRGLGMLDAKAAADPTSVAKIERVFESANVWHRRLRLDGVVFDLVREDSHFFVQIGPDSSANTADAPLALRSIDDSFMASDIVRAAPDLVRDGGVSVAEIYVNLEPVWNAVELVAPPQVKSTLAAAGCTSIRGLSASAALGHKGIDESFFVLVPSGKDLLTRTLTHRPLDASLAHYIPASAPTASLAAFDVGVLYDGVTKLLSESDRSELQKTVSGFRKDGVDFRKDLIDNVGPTFGFSGTLESFAPDRSGDGPAREVDATMLVQVGDGARLRAFADVLVARSGLADHVHAKDIHGFTTYALDALPLPGPDGRTIATIQPHWYVGDDVFMFSLSRSSLARSLAAAWDETNRGPVALKAALEHDADGLFAVTTMSSADGNSPATTIGRRTGLGLEVSTREGPGLATAYSLVAGSAMLSSIMIPKLMSARLQANERAAIETLRAIATAESKFRTAAHVDQDADGAGEFGTLAELTGTAPMRGREIALAPPLLAADSRFAERGVILRSGYLFRVDLSTRLTRVIDFDEREFVIHAWPLQRGATGVRAFTIDANARIEVTDNRGEGQQYSGLDNAPASDAAKNGKASKTPPPPGTHFGRDGGVWRALD